MSGKSHRNVGTCSTKKNVLSDADVVLNALTMGNHAMGSPSDVGVYVMPVEGVVSITMGNDVL